ncbi:uncharacterized protein LOC143177336 [Calliopsis andreniformis]|uniref:uncharacterized protein LOC143177336 n=1 Tax=Calliopsis andreniformis TaxID=337506 RepID=UPI003FCC8EFE
MSFRSQSAPQLICSASYLYSERVKPLFLHFIFFYQLGEKPEMGTNHVESRLTCNFVSRSRDKFKIKSDGTGLHQISGDWKYNDEIVDSSLPGNIVPELKSSPEWKRKNLYSISDFDRSNYWNQNGVDSRHKLPPNVLRDIYKRIDNRYQDVSKSDDKSNFLHNIREYLVKYQESCGVPRTEYSFPALIRLMGQATGRSLLALLYVMLNIIPVVEVFLYILRFVLDKVISIRSSKDFRQTMIRCLVFTTELFSVYVCLIFIFGFIVLPIVQMVIGIIGKIMLYN